MTEIKAVEELEIPEGHGLLSIMDATGDTRIMWDPRNKDDLAAAKDAFDSARKRGMTVYLVDPESGESNGEVVTEFPKKAGKLIAVRQMQGG